ncbi:aminotransferase class V-fold PLP-dependent enzyme [Leptolyngbyaceae cyanobacterium CCMR0082]|uniref:Aminotransferase class V-fold PLP-dependent enzyme n=2 Tax=Adonisia turfae TaxID=2950184 RepID=A0A6M0S8U3_9CYAN|nr:aminotransferase class V-fold PLP-dependent enzyme [Adonisia turfae CCMR0081]NEZ64391.1 aminotransferase class V-fold PLP-dependent enzyme [Adonisia turfae CCMR0082]
MRSQFPAFAEPSLDGWGFFENAGGSYTCRQVISHLNDYYTQTKVQPYYNYPAAQKAGAAMDEAYRQLAAYLNVSEDDVHFGPSTTQNLYVLAHAFREIWHEGDEIILSNQDHEANAGFWRRLEKTGIVIKEWRIAPETGRLNPDHLDTLLSDRTRLLAFPHCSNVIGHTNPVAEIVSKVKTADICVVVDGVAHAPHGLPDIRALGVDIYLFSLYKTWGPHLGLMTIKKEIMDKLPNQGHSFNAHSARKKMLPAGPDHAQIAAAVGVAQYLDTVYEHHFSEAVNHAEKGRQLKKLFQEHEKSLLKPLLEWLRQRDDISIIGPDDPALRAPTVSVVPKKKSIDEICAVLAEKKLMVGQGNFYSMRPLAEMNIPVDTGVLRLSFLHYTIEDEISQLINGLAAALD